jgi:hypothetical protein
MLFAVTNVIFTFILVFGKIAEGASTATSPAVPYPTPLHNNDPTYILQVLAGISRSNSQAPNSTDGQPPLQQPAPQQPPTEQTSLQQTPSWDPEDPPKQVCPEPRIMCWMPDCGGKSYLADPFRCKSKSITVVDSVATTLFDCPCCPGGN